MRSYDVVVIGAGIIGASIACALAQEKLRVGLFDRRESGREASWAAAGMLSPVPETAADIPLVPYGRASLEMYPRFIAEIEEISGLPTGYRRDGAIELFFSADAERKLSTLIALHHGLGLPTEPLPIEEARKLEPGIGRQAQAAALLPYEGTVDNRALTAAVLAAAVNCGAELHENTEITAVLSTSSASARGRCTGVVAGAENISAGNVVLAAGAYSENIAGLSTPVATRPIRGQMVALSGAGIELYRALRSDRGYLVPRHDAVPQRIVAGSTLEDAHFEKRVTPRGLEHILSAAQELLSGIADAAIVETWCGLRPDTPDHLPILGPAELENLTIATGHYRNGILLTPITAKLVREWITEQRVSMDWELFSPLRFTQPPPD